MKRVGVAPRKPDVLYDELLLRTEQKGTHVSTARSRGWRSYGTFRDRTIRRSYYVLCSQEKEGKKDSTPVFQKNKRGCYTVRGTVPVVRAGVQYAVTAHRQAAGTVHALSITKLKFRIGFSGTR